MSKGYHIKRNKQECRQVNVTLFLKKEAGAVIRARVGWLVGWLFWVKRPFETVFQSVSGRLPERGRKRRERIEETKNVQTTPYPHLLQAQ